MTEDEMVGWHHQVNACEFEQARGDVEGQGSLACCSLWGHRETDMTKHLNNNNLDLWSPPPRATPPAPLESHSTKRVWSPLHTAVCVSVTPASPPCLSCVSGRTTHWPRGCDSMNQETPRNVPCCPRLRERTIRTCRP